MGDEGERLIAGLRAPRVDLLRQRSVDGQPE
jgi:hypothetical protein